MIPFAVLPPLIFQKKTVGVSTIPTLRGLLRFQRAVLSTALDKSCRRWYIDLSAEWYHGGRRMSIQFRHATLPPCPHPACPAALYSPFSRLVHFRWLSL